MAQAETIKIGVVLPFSGANADLGHQVDKAFDLYVKLHAKDIEPNKVEIIKRDEGPPTGAQAKTVATELITNDKVQILTGFVFSPSAIALAPVGTAKVPMIIANAGTSWITNLSPYIARLSFSIWHHAYPMGAYAFDKIGWETSARPTPTSRRVRTRRKPLNRFRKGRRKGHRVQFRWAAQCRCQTSRRSFSASRTPNRIACTSSFPSGAHATGVTKAYGELGMRKAGVKLIGPMDLIPDNKLQDMGDAAIGTVVMGNYAVDLDNADNKAFNKAWHEAYGKDSYPDFMSAAGWDTMHAIFDAIKKLNGKVDDGAKVIDVMKGWTGNGPRGQVSIDAVTRDIVQDEHAMEVIRKPDGKLGIKVLGTTKAVKDECKELKVGRCGS